MASAMAQLPLDAELRESPPHRAVLSRDGLPTVTVVVPCRNEERHLERCLGSIAAQDYTGNLEILIADGMSSDASRERLARFAGGDPRVRLLDNPERRQAPGLNRGLREARGDVIVRMDVHCEYAPDYISQCVDVLARTGADNVGGPQRMHGTTPFARAICTMFKSPLAFGGAQYRSPLREGPIDTVFLGAFRRDVFERVGLYDPKALTNEDAELNQRITEAGGRLHQSPRIVVRYFPRESLAGIARQYFAYGFGRARTFLKHRRLPVWRPAVPFLAVAIAFALLTSPTLRPAAPFVFGLYAAIVVLESVRTGWREGAYAIGVAMTLLPLMHASHGLGFGVGLARYLVKPDWTVDERLPKRPIERPSGVGHILSQ